MNDYRVTEEGYDFLFQRIENCEKELAELAKERYEVVRSESGINSTLYFLEEEERIVSNILKGLREKIRRAKIVEKEKNSQIVELGSIVSLLFDDGEKRKFKIVDPERIDVFNGLISYESPLGKAILGATPGETRTYLVNNTHYKVKIIEVNY